MVYLNGQFVTAHSGGHLPFEADVTDVLKYSEKKGHLRSFIVCSNFALRNLVTVAVNNTLTRFTVPQGYVRWGEEAQGYPAGDLFSFFSNFFFKF